MYYAPAIKKGMYAFKIVIKMLTSNFYDTEVTHLLSVTLFPGGTQNPFVVWILMGRQNVGPCHHCMVHPQVADGGDSL
jgi:hypothetical protein